MKRFIMLVLAIALLATPGLAFGETVYLNVFEPQVFRNAVMAQLGINEAEMKADSAVLAGITTLSLSGKSITEVKGLEYLTGLEELDLSNNRISSLNGLAGLKKLKKLNVSDNTIEDISVLAELTALEELDISKNRFQNGADGERKGIQDIGALAGLTALRKLNLSGNYITDLSALKNLTAMEELDVSNNAQLNSGTGQRPMGGKLSDISALAKMTRLKVLDISDNSISQVDALEGMKDLQWLDASNNLIEDASVIDRMGIRSINLSGNPVMRGIEDALTTLPQTGDGAMPLLWSVLMLLSIAGFAVMDRRGRSGKLI